MANNSHQPIDTQSKKTISNPTPVAPPPVQLPDVQPVISEAQRVAAQTSVSGRRAVSRGTIFLAFYLWLLAGVALLSFFAQRTELFPGDRSITAGLQKHRSPWIRRFFFIISEIGFPKWTV